jgi:hypothetical protein
MRSEKPCSVRVLGSVRIFSLNQVGECLRYDKKSGSFCLSRYGSLFDLLVHADPEDGLVDFRTLPSLTVSLRFEDSFFAIDKESGKAVLATRQHADIIPPCAIFHYERRKFDRSSASIAFVSEGKELWLRHSNSKLRVC